MNAHTIRTLVSLWQRKPGSPAPAPAPAPRRTAFLTPPALHLVRALTPVLAAVVRRVARLLRPVA